MDNLKSNKGEDLLTITEKWKKIGFLEGVDDEKLKNRIANHFEEALQYLLTKSKKEKESETAVFPIILTIFTKKDESENIPIIKNFNTIELVNRIIIIWEKIYPPFMNNFRNNECIDAEAEFTYFISDLLQKEYKITDNKI